MERNKKHHKPLLAPGSRIVFGPFDQGFSNAIAFADGSGRAMKFSAGSIIRNGQSIFPGAMSAHECTIVADIIGRTFGLGVNPPDTRGFLLTVSFAKTHAGYAAPVGIIHDRSEMKTIIKLPHKTIITPANRVPDSNKGHLAEMLAALHGFDTRTLERLDRTVWGQDYEEATA